MDSVPYGRLLFVLPEGKTAADASPAMQAAFKAAAEKMEPSFSTTRVCLGRKRRDPTEVFVCDPFAGAAFEHLRQIQARVVGPLCVSMAIRTQVALPCRAEPVYSLAFRNLVLTCSALASGERERLKTLVELMGGSMVAPLTASVTHVVAGDVGSKKYHVAASKKLPVMQPSWVQFFWDTEQYNLAHANHPSYAHMRLPAFKGLVITVSQVPAAERKKLQALVESNGGSYSGQLLCKKTTHLALLDATGDKYDHACLWKLHCVHVRWLHESAEAGYALDESLYAVEPRKTSTPNRLDPNSSLPSWDCSAISSKIDLTHLSESGCTNESSLVLPDGHPRDPVDDVDVERLSTCCGQFLDGCCVLLWGFAQEKLEKMRKVVNACGGARLDEYKEGVTHVVVAESEGPSEIVKLIQRHGRTPHVLSAKWFAESCMSGKLQKIDMYLLADLHSNVDSAELPSDCLPSSTTGRRKSVGLEQSPALAPDFTYIVEQYRGSVNVGTNVWDAAPTSYQERSVSTTSASGKDEASFTLGPAEASARSSALAQSTLENVEPFQALFTGMTFRIHDFKKEDELILEEAVTRNGGTIFRDSGVEKMGEQQLIDVVPLVVDSQEEYSHLSGRIVTYCWLQACIHFERLLPFEDNTLFLQFTRPPSQEPLRDCVISFSQYCSPEREFLIHLAETLGATCQEFLARSANRSKQRKLRPNTHLVAREPEGSKFKAATSWGLPVVTKDWLIASAKSGFKMNEDMFLVISPDSLSPAVSPAPNMSCGQKDARDEEALQQPDSSADGPNMSCGTPSERVSPEVRPCTEATGPAQETCSVQSTGSFTPGKKPGDVASPVWGDEQSGNAVCGRLHMGATQPPSTPDGRRKVSTSSAATPESFLQSQRLRELVSEGHHSINSSTASIDASTEDESFQQPIDGSYKPKLNITGLEESFLVAKENRDTPRRSRSLSLGEQVVRNIELYIELLRAQDDLKELLASPSPSPEKAPVQCAAPRPLAGAVVCVSKKLAHVQKELGDIVGELGGQFVLAYSEQCTHMVHQGKPGEAVPDSSADGPNMSCGTPSERVSPKVRPCTEATGPAQETCSVQSTGSFTPGKKPGDVASPVWGDEQSGNAVCGRLHMGATQPPSTPDGRRKVSTSSAATPGSFLQSQRLRELVSEGHHSINSSTASIDASTEDESFQQPIDGSYKPKLNITGLEESFLVAKENRDTPRRSRSLSLGEQVVRNIELYIERLRAQDDLKELLASPSPSPEKAPVQCAAPRPLAGAVVCVSKKLAHVQKELGDIVGELGGQFVLAYSEQCTHMVHQGKPGEAVPDSSADGPNMSCGTPSERVSPKVRPCTEATGPAQETCSVQSTGSFTPGKKPGDVASPVWGDEQSGNAVCGRLHMGATQPPSTPDGRRKVSTSSAATPGSFLQSQRLRELVSEGHHSINSSTASIDASTEDESFQQPIDGSYKPKLNITGLEESFLVAKENRDTPRRSRSLSLGEQVARNFELYLERFRAQDDLKELLASPSPEKAPVQCAAPRPLAGAVVCVSKKLAHVQKELGDIVGELGGQFVLAYSEQCTHMVHQGKPGEAVPREVLCAREQGKKLVSCGWVYACKGAGSWLDEADFPSALDGRLSLEGHVSAVLIPKQRSQQTSPPKPVRPPPEEPKAVERPDHQLIHAQLDEIMRFATEVERRRSLLPLPPPPTKASTPHSRPKSAPAPPVRSKLACSPNEIFASLSDSEAGSVQITWDDPTRRMEMARLADKLAKPQKSDSSPSPEEEEEANVGEQEEEEKEGVADTVEPAVESPDKVFVLSGFSDEQKNHYTSIVAKLNGRLLTSKAYNPEMTHLVLVLCMRSERYLGALAAGKFILHTAYLDECAKAGRFLDEEEFEWGGPMTDAYLKSLSTTKAQKVKGSDAYAPRRWRQRIAEQPLNAKGAFWDWRVVIYAGASRIPAYVNVLTAGGATILPSTVMSDHVGPGEVTHALFDPGAAKGMQLSPFVDADILCLKVEYIAAVLVEDPPPPPEGYYIPEVVKLLRSRRGSEEV